MGDAALDSGVLPPADAGVGDAVVGDAVVGDAVVGDTGPRPVRLVEALPACGDEPDRATIALYRMNDLLDGRLHDATDEHPGVLYESVTARPGPRGCGTAFDTRAGAYAIVPHADVFKLERGAVDIWIYFESLPGPRDNCSVFLSRDAQGQALPGHFSIYLTDEARIGLRLQSDSVREGSVAIFSAAPYAPGVWHHVGVNFGPDGVALYIDGALTEGGAVGGCSDVGTVCSGACATGIEGNANPWVVGAGATISDEGNAVPTNLFFVGAIDELRISSTHRDFAGAGL